MQKSLIFQEFEDLKKAITLLEASIYKYKPYRSRPDYSPEELEYYDALSFRFEKSIELTLSFFKGLEMFASAKASDILRDRLLVMQKLYIINDIDFWLEARILRNKIAHTYIAQELSDLYQEVYDKAGIIFETMKKIENYLAKIT